MAYPFECDVHIKKYFRLLFGDYASKIWDDVGNLTIEAPDGLVEIISDGGLYVNGVQVVPGAGGTSVHNSLTGIQDAAPAVAGEHYHLSLAQAASAQLMRETHGDTGFAVKGDSTLSFSAGTPPSISVITSSIGDNSRSVSVSVQAGDLICVSFCLDAALTANTPTDNAAGGSNTYYQAGNGSACIIDPSSARIFYAKAKATEALTIIMSGSGNYPITAASVVRVTGSTWDIASILDGTPAGKYSTARATSHSTENVSIGSSCAYIFAALSEFAGSGNVTENGTGFTIRQQVTGTGFSDRIVSSPGTYLDQFTSPVSTSYSTMIAGFKPAATTVRNFSISPSGSSFDIYVSGNKITKTGGASCETSIPNTVGTHFIFFDTSGVLQNSMTGFAAGSCPVAIVYWDGTSGVITDLRLGAGQPTWPGHRELLSSARTYYVRTDGNDANTGLTNTSGGAFKTIQKAVDIVCDKLDMAGYGVIIQVRDGTFTGNIVLRNYVGRVAPVIIGNTTTPSSCLLSTASHAVNAAHSGPWYIKGFKITTTANGVGIVASRGSLVYLSNIDFGVCSAQHMFATQGTIVIETNYAISGGCLHHMVSEQGGIISNGGAGRVVTITNTPNLGVFALAQTRGNILFGGNIYSGSATGVRYSATTGSFIQAGTATPPGNTAGSVSTGGYFTT